MRIVIQSSWITIRHLHQSALQTDYDRHASLLRIIFHFSSRFLYTIRFHYCTVMLMVCLKMTPAESFA